LDDAALHRAVDLDYSAAVGTIVGEEHSSQ
jgi:hypothetical protein